MSFCSTVNIRTEIARLTLTQEEKDTLFSHFTIYKNQEPNALKDLSFFDTDKDKLLYLRIFLSKDSVA
jgi:hypothetical protein